MSNNISNKKSIIFLSIILLVVAILYYQTACRTIFVGDTAELSATIFCNGIAHPPGYPLYTTLGFFLTRPIYAFVNKNLIDFAFLSNLYSALLTLGGLIIFFKILLLFAEILFYNNDKYLKNSNQEQSNSFIAQTNNYIIFGVLLTIFIAATSVTLWEQSLITEVYTFEFLLINIFFYLYLKFFFNAVIFRNLNKQTNNKNLAKKSRDFITANKRTIILLSLFFALAFTHRPTSIFLIIFFIAILYYFKDYLFYDNKLFLYKIVGFCLGLSTLLLMMLKSFAQPLMNWGNPNSLTLLIEHFSGKLYHNRLFNLPFEKVIANLSAFFLLISNQHFWFLFIPIIIIGFIWLLKNNRQFVLPFLLYQLILVFYAINYDIPDIDAYYIPVFTIAFIYFFCGIIIILNLAKINVLKYCILICVGVLFIFSALQNYKHLDISNKTQLRDYIDNILLTAPENAILILAGDDVIGSFQYMQVVHKKRLDVIGIAMNFDNYEWYYNQLRKRYPLLAVPQYLNDAPDAMTRRIINANIENKTIACLYSREKLFNEYVYMPMGVLGQLLKPNTTINLQVDSSIWRKYIIRNFENYKYGKQLKTHTDVRLRNIFETYCNTSINLAIYYMNNRMFDKMFEMLEFTEKLDINFPQTKYIKAVYFYNSGNRAKTAELLKNLQITAPDFEPQQIQSLLDKCMKK